jgi:heme/copper-type cytochrome/quinol oxidase subunit 2
MGEAFPVMTYGAIALAVGMGLGWRCMSDRESRGDRAAWALVLVAAVLWAIVLPVAVVQVGILRSADSMHDYEQRRNLY